MDSFVIRLRHIRILGISSFEILLIVLLGVLIVPLRLESWMKYLALIFLTGIVVHAIFGVNTALNWQLGLSECPPNFDSILGMECK
jgi:hypothetical protein